MKTERQVWYEEEGLAKGVTVAEFEEWYFLPPYSVYPEAAQAKTWRDKGYFMYRGPTPEEREEMAASASRRMKAPERALTFLELRAKRAAKSKRDSERYEKRKSA